MADMILTDQNFESEVLKSDKPVLVDFYADWCGPCQIYGPIIEELAKSLDGKIKVGKLNVDQNPAITEKYGVMSIPTTIVFKNGEILKQFLGAQPKETLEQELGKILS